jgi:hypothetical protein
MGLALTDLVGNNDAALSNMSLSDWLTEGNVTCASCNLQMTQTTTVTVNSVANSTSLLASIITATQVGATYQWLDCNNGNAIIIIIGKTDQSYEPIVNGDYAVQISFNGCVDTSTCVNITGVGITNIEMITASVHPNPTEGFVNIVTTEVIEAATIYSINGAFIKKINGNVRSINVTDLVQGMYILELQSEK